MKYPLTPLKSKIKFPDNIYGFDIETHGESNNFTCASVYSDDFYKFYTEISDFIYDLKNLKQYKNSLFAATNLMFDFMGIFRDRPDDIKNFNLCFRNGTLLSASSYIKNKGFSRYLKNKDKNGKRTKRSKSPKITFIDTMNYAPFSVAKLGVFVGCRKHKSPDFSKYPDTPAKMRRMKRYNKRDAKISYLFIKKFYEILEDIGAAPKITIAAVAMDLFRRKYLKDKFWRSEEEHIKEQFKAYYGGRTEAFKRGYIKNKFMYDVSSLYPFSMKNEFPDPRYERIRYKGVIENINEYEGISDVSVYCPKHIDKPLLPYRYDNKLLFPTGDFKGYYTHVELREAVKLGYVITDIRRQYYYKKTLRPFDSYVDDIYKKRNQYKKGSLLNLTYKLLLNSLYGKFGQKFDITGEWEHIDNLDSDYLKNMEKPEISGEFVYIKKEKHIPLFCFPVWSAYITAYGRLHMRKYLVNYDAYYTDTDSLVTSSKIPYKEGLGGMELEYVIDDGIIVKPKFYIFNDKLKIKGLGVESVMAFNKIDDKMELFKRIASGERIDFKKMVRYNESMRRKDNVKVNSWVSANKIFDHRDNKRYWKDDHLYFDDFTESRPINMIEGLPENIYNEKIAELTTAYKKNMMDSRINEDTFDSMGSDISKEEYMENIMEEYK